MNSQGLEEELASVAGEVLGARSSEEAVVGSSQLESGRIRSTLGSEGISEFGVADSAVKVSVVALDEEENVLRDGINSIGSKGVAEIGGGEGAEVVSVEKIEGVWEIEVRLESKSVLSILKLIFKGNLLLEASDKLTLIINSHGRESSGGAA